MRTSARGSFRPESGFTLVELLIVVLIIGATIGLAVLAMDRGTARLDVEARRLQQLMEHAASRARLSGVPLAWQWTGHGYRFLGRGDAWREVPGFPAGDVLRSRTLPESISIHRADDTQADPSTSEERVVVIFPASGLAQPFALVLRSPGESDVTITGNAGGRISILRDAK